MASGKSWMASTWAAKQAMFANIAAKIGGYATALGLSAGEVTAVIDMCDQYAQIYSYYTQVQAWAQGQTQWRDLAMSGEPQGDPMPLPTTAPLYNPTGSELIGMLDAFREERDRWVAAAGYTQAIGEDLMIVAADSDGLSPELVQPTIKVFPAQTGYMFSIIVEGREKADAWTVETKVLPDGGWTNSGTFTGKSTDVSITPPEAAIPLQVQIRVQLRKSNANYGQLSQIATVTVNP